MPVLKREKHRKRLHQALGNSKFFMGTDSAPHEVNKKESSCGCAGIFSSHAALELYAMAFEEAGYLPYLQDFCTTRGADFYGIDRNTTDKPTVLKKEEWQVPKAYPFENGGQLVPLFAGQTISYTLAK